MIYLDLMVGKTKLKILSAWAQSVSPSRLRWLRWLTLVTLVTLVNSGYAG